MTSAVVDKFWMVQGVGPHCEPAAVVHLNRPDATNEAKRLAKYNPNCVFYVMESQYGYTTNPENVRDTSAQKVTVQII